MRFQATIERSGKATTRIPLPAELATRLGASRRPRVHVTLRGYRYRARIRPLDDGFFVPLSVGHRTNARVRAGDDVEIDIELDRARAPAVATHGASPAGLPPVV